MYAKYHIYINKQFENNNVNFYRFLQSLNCALKREIIILEKNNNKMYYKYMHSWKIKCFNPKKVLA